MTKAEELQVKLDEANTTTNDMAADVENISADIARIKEQLAGGVSAAEAAQLQAQLDAHVTKLGTLGVNLKAVAAIVPEDAPAGGTQQGRSGR